MIQQLFDARLIDRQTDRSWDKLADGQIKRRFKLLASILQDLHRTGYSGFSGGEDNASRSSLKRVLLAYARWNKDVGYCQGFNVMVALLLQVMDGREEDALKVVLC